MIDPSKLAQLRKPYVNETCIGCAACTAICSEVFAFGDDGLSHAGHLDDYESIASSIDDAIVTCPVNAISWQSV